MQQFEWSASWRKFERIIFFFFFPLQFVHELRSFVLSSENTESVQGSNNEIHALCTKNDFDSKYSKTVKLGWNEMIGTDLLIYYEFLLFGRMIKTQEQTEATIKKIEVRRLFPIFQMIHSLFKRCWWWCVTFYPLLNLTSYNNYKKLFLFW